MSFELLVDDELQKISSIGDLLGKVGEEGSLNGITCKGLSRIITDAVDQIYGYYSDLMAEAEKEVPNVKAD